MIPHREAFFLACECSKEMAQPFPAEISSTALAARGRARGHFSWISFRGDICLTCGTTTENGFCLLVFQMKHEYVKDFINLIK